MERLSSDVFSAGIAANIDTKGVIFLNTTMRPPTTKAFCESCWREKAEKLPPATSGGIVANTIGELHALKRLIL
jgi:hypothetical protein